MTEAIVLHDCSDMGTYNPYSMAIDLRMMNQKRF